MPCSYTSQDGEEDSIDVSMSRRDVSTIPKSQSETRVVDEVSVGLKRSIQSLEESDKELQGFPGSCLEGSMK